MNDQSCIQEPHWVPGDGTGLAIPADAQALRQGGADYLTHIFRACGVLDAANRVTEIREFAPFVAGGTGSKLQLAVAYAQPTAGLQTQLFVKFSRNFADPIRDRVRFMLQPEIQFAALSREPGFPIVVPECYFADFHQSSGTGMLITGRIPYGENGVEPQHVKCMDHVLPDPVGHYRAIMKALGCLSGTHRAGRLPAGFYQVFPFQRQQAMAADPLRYRGDQLARRLSRLQTFASSYPQLLPDNVRDPVFLRQFADQAPQLVAREQAIRQWLYSDDDMIALCHWNANVDNAWFWQDDSGELTCGLMDWGAVGQMNVAKSIYGAFSGANPVLWDNHLDEMLATFADAYQACGGPRLTLETLRSQVLLVTGLMGVGYLLDAPAIIERRLGDPGAF